MPPAAAAQNIGVGLCRGETFVDMLVAMARIAFSQPNEAMARIAPRSPIKWFQRRRTKFQPNHTDSAEMPNSSCCFFEPHRN
jgi:hypothetical protein